MIFVDFEWYLNNIDEYKNGYFMIILKLIGLIYSFFNYYKEIFGFEF